MNRTTWLQDRRMEKFCDLLSRWKARELSAQDAGEILGFSERQFRRYRRRYEEEGLTGLFDKRLGKASARRVPIDQVSWMLSEYRTHYTGWTVKHFFDHLRKQHNFRWSYTWVKTQLHTARLVMPAPRRGAHRRKRPRKPCIGMMLHQDGSRYAWLTGQPELDLINRTARYRDPPGDRCPREHTFSLRRIPGCLQRSGRSGGPPPRSSAGDR